MQILNEFYRNVISGKVVVDLGCAAFNNPNKYTTMLSEKSRRWYGFDNDTEFINKNKSKDNIFYADLNDMLFMTKVKELNVDLITLTEVLEHLKSPFHVLEYICSNKNSNTEVLFSVPNGLSAGKIIYALLNRKKLLKQDIYHYYSFNEQTISNICRDVGFKEFKVLTYTRTSTMQFFLNPFTALASGFIVHGR